MTDSGRPSEPLYCPSQGQECLAQQELTALREQVASLTEQAHTDALTGLYNYRHFKQTLSDEMERVHRTGQPLSLVLADVDHFKAFNDTYGHEQGNRLLKALAEQLSCQLRRLDVLCRFGGEEFAIILPGTALNLAQTVAERIRAHIARYRLLDDCDAHVSMSFGVACFKAENLGGVAELTELADKQLYRAKEQGRNRVCVAEDGLRKAESVTHEEKAALFAMLRDDDQDEYQE